jgi:2'-5' RNA ligase
MADGVYIAYLPENGAWCKQDLPHMTLVYCGTLEENNETDLNAMGKDAISAARITGPLSLPVTAVEQLGEGDEAVDALILYPTPQLLLARKIVEHWNKSEYTEFKPHATIGPAGSAFSSDVPYYDNYDYDVSYRESRYAMMKKSTLPDRLYFNRIAVIWGDKKLIFNTNSF